LGTHNSYPIRDGGSTASAIDEDGPLGVSVVGRYDETLALNLFSDDRLVEHASWHLNLHTADELRWPQIVADLRRSPELVADWLATDVGSRIALVNLPDEVSYDDADLILEGYDETLTPVSWDLGLNCAPASPYDVAVVSDTADIQDVPRVGSATAVLASGIDADDTSLSVTTGAGGLWTTGSGDFPMDVNVGGERVRLSGIAGTSSPQTFTASARSVNGVVKAHLADTRVEVWQTARVGL
jgi:hypothetical protein